MKNESVKTSTALKVSDLSDCHDSRLASLQRWAKLSCVNNIPTGTDATQENNICVYTHICGINDYTLYPNQGRLLHGVKWNSLFNRLWLHFSVSLSENWLLCTPSNLSSLTSSARWLQAPFRLALTLIKSCDFSVVGRQLNKVYLIVVLGIICLTVL